MSAASITVLTVEVVISECSHEWPCMYNKKLIAVIHTLVLVVLSTTIIRTWNHRTWRSSSTYPTRNTIRVTITRPGARLSHAAKLSAGRQSAPAGDHHAALRGAVVRSADLAQHHLSGSKAQLPALRLPPKNTAAPHVGSSSRTLPLDVAVVLFCYDREEYLNQTLHSLAGLRGLDGVSLYISQDGKHKGVRGLVERAAKHRSFSKPAVRRFEHWEHPRVPELGWDQPGHAWLTQHYKWALDRAFHERGHSHVIVVEDDMIFSPDFLTLFQEAAPLLALDPSIWCVSSWNDNGQAFLQWDREKLYRTSYFPGLGWMMRRELWLEIGPHFPLQAWDHWMRLDTTSKGRDCIVPEVNRNKNIGQKGVNMHHDTFTKYIAKANWEEQGVDGFRDLTYLTRDKYAASVTQLAANATLWEGKALSRREFQPGQAYLVPYKLEDYKDLVEPLGLWPFPRGHHNGLTRVPVGGAVLLLADRRVCPYLPAELRILPAPRLRPTAGRQAQDCHSTCSDVGMRCSEGDFPFINRCALLQRAFGCERGCAVELGLDIPNYVMDPSLPGHGTCLVSQQQPTCDATHSATARLCPCV